MSNIVLIGFMGVGKSTVGMQLAEILGMSYIDTDQMIEEMESKTISEIFSEEGESHFRYLESSLIKNSNFQNSVISVGGGMPCFNDNLEGLKKIGTTIYLKISAKNLAERLWVGRKKRPLIKDVKSIDELEAYISSLLDEREKYYSLADILLDVNGQASCEILQELSIIVKNLK